MTGLVKLLAQSSNTSIPVENNIKTSASKGLSHSFCPAPTLLSKLFPFVLALQCPALTLIMGFIETNIVINQLRNSIASSSAGFLQFQWVDLVQISIQRGKKKKRQRRFRGTCFCTSVYVQTQLPRNLATNFSYVNSSSPVVKLLG